VKGKGHKALFCLSIATTQCIQLLIDDPNSLQIGWLTSDEA
jgi:hypothetical protein